MGAPEGVGGGGGVEESGVNLPFAKHCCQIAENSAILLKSSGKNIFLQRNLMRSKVAEK